LTDVYYDKMVNTNKFSRTLHKEDVSTATNCKQFSLS